MTEHRFAFLTGGSSLGWAIRGLGLAIIVLAAALAFFPRSVVPPGPLPGLIDADWLEANLGRPRLCVIDCRTQSEYDQGHVPGSVWLGIESLRGVVDGIPSMLLPARTLAGRFALLGVTPADVVVLVSGENVRDATLVGMALERLGHKHWAILDGAMPGWIAEERPIDDATPEITPIDYPAPEIPDGFTVDADDVKAVLGDGKTIVLDTRPADHYAGAKTAEPRAGHVPDAINRPIAQDLAGSGLLKPADDLRTAYAAIIPSPDRPVIVYCRTGHQASQTYFVLRHLLGHPNVKWYDGSWTEWSARSELPIE